MPMPRLNIITPNNVRLKLTKSEAKYYVYGISRSARARVKTKRFSFYQPSLLQQTISVPNKPLSNDRLSPKDAIPNRDVREPIKLVKELTLTASRATFIGNSFMVGAKRNSLTQNEARRYVKRSDSSTANSFQINRRESRSQLPVIPRPPIISQNRRR
jgi:hypothetical protein